MRIKSNRTDSELQVYASLRILGADVMPTTITERLGLTPSESFQAGDPRGKVGVWPHGYWEYSSKGQIKSRNLEEHLVWLLKRIEPVREEIIQLVALGNVVDIFCFWQFGPGQNGLVLSSHILKGVAELGLNLGIDVYGSD